MNKDKFDQNYIPEHRQIPEYINEKVEINHDHPIIPSYEQPNPSIATPHIPLEMPSRNIRD